MKKRKAQINKYRQQSDEVSTYIDLLQRIDECKNMVILASNLKDNFDEAFLRRFQSIIYFPLPNKEERLRLWKNGFSVCKYS